MDFAAANGIPITPRGAGSNLSGSAVGDGLVILTREMDRLVGKERTSTPASRGWSSTDWISRAGDGFFIPYDPSSRAFCTIGGNVGTRASGIRSLKYGSTDSCLDSIRFVNPVFGVVDTAKELPLNSSWRWRTSPPVSARTRRCYCCWRAGPASSPAADTTSARSWRRRMNRIAAHLMVGSVGTLAVFTEIRLRLRTVHKERVLYLAFFDSLSDAVRRMLPARAFGPSGFELLDSFGVKNMAAWCRRRPRRRRSS